MTQLLNLIFGLGLFLFGMQQIEAGIKSFAGPGLKQWLERSTSNPIRGVFSGTIITGILQSSSMVSLMMLAFASAGAIPLYNAVSVILGANLGTTFTGWIVTTLGFKLQLAEIAIPAMGIGALLRLFPQSEAINCGKLVFGFGLLLFGLDWMKGSVEDVQQLFQLSSLSGHGPFFYFIAGTFLSAVMQSSSATMMLTLAALNSGLIDLHSAAALVIGADLGTTSTTLLGAIKGTAIKKQLALAHFLFNVVVDISALFLLLPFLPKMLALIDLKDPLYSLVAFHSLFNFLGLVVFIPLLKPFCELLKRIAPEPVAVPLLHYINRELLKEPDVALTAMEQEIRQLLIMVFSINLRNIKLNTSQLHLSQEYYNLLNDSFDQGMSFEECYEKIKKTEGLILNFATQLQQMPLSQASADKMTALLTALREMIYATKTMKDIRVNLANFRHSGEELLLAYNHRYHEFFRSLYKKLIEFSQAPHEANYAKEILADLDAEVNTAFDETNAQIHEHSRQDSISQYNISTLLNVSREMLVANKSLISTVTQLIKTDNTALPETAR